MPHTQKQTIGHLKVNFKIGLISVIKKSHKYAKYKIHPNIFLCKS